MIIGTEVDHRVDVYSLGCLLYQCLIGEPPFPGAREVEVLHAHLRQPPPRPSDRRPELPAALDDVIAAAMAKEPDGRPDSCRAVIDAARAATAGLRIEPPVAAPPLRRPTQEPDAGPRAGVEAGVDAGDPPIPAGQISLEVTAGNAVGTVIDVDDELLVGRSADGVGRLADDVEISRRHARIFRTPGGRYAVEDLVSTNGTYVNGRRITDVTPLEVGDWMDIGTTTLVVRVCVPGPAVALPIDPEPAALPPLLTPVEDLPPTGQVAPPLRAPGDLPGAEPPPPALRPVDDLPDEDEDADADVAPVAAPVSAGVDLGAGEAVDPAPLSLRLEIDLAGRTVRIHLDDESEPVSFVHRDGRWRAADAG
jgi:pSer/pThr/pTyr-binding forkhead associated (FHA) protein